MQAPGRGRAGDHGCRPRDWGRPLAPHDAGTFRYHDLETTRYASPATFRRWLRILRTSGILTSGPVPGTNRTEARFTIHLPVPQSQCLRFGSQFIQGLLTPLIVPPPVRHA